MPTDEPLDPRRPQRSRPHLSRIAEVMDVGVVLLDESGRLDFASDRARELLAMTGEPSDWERVVDGWSPLLERAGEAPEGSVELDVEDDPERLKQALRLLIHRIDDHEDGGFLVLIRDLGTARALERDLQMAAQLRGLMGLYMGVTHDLRAPLNAMALNVELLKRSLADDEDSELSAKQRRRIDILEEELGRLRRSLDRVLAQAAPARPDAVRYDLGAVVSDVAELLAPQARQQKVTLEVDVPEGRLLTFGAPDLAKQALVNLAVNGFEAMPEGGRMRLVVFAAADEVVVSVADSGAGIPEEIRDRVFDLHFTTKPAGTGIGLYVTRTLIQSQGGRVRLVETGAKGTHFEIRLPSAGSVPAATEVA